MSRTKKREHKKGNQIENQFDISRRLPSFLFLCDTLRVFMAERKSSGKNAQRETIERVRGTPARWTTLNERMTQHTQSLLGGGQMKRSD